jgi:hypothetical protein
VFGGYAGVLVGRHDAAAVSTDLLGSSEKSTTAATTRTSARGFNLALAAHYLPQYQIIV